MSEKRTFILAHDLARRNAVACVSQAPDGYHVTVQPANKRRIQEEKYHAMIGDIARQTEYAGKRWDADDTKRILIDEFAEEMRLAGTPLHHDGRLIPSANGRRVIQLGIQSRDFYVKEAAQFIEFLNAWGADRGVVWSGREASP
ncbi:MAG TPA: recombination protein NinB [Steroidobacteraceae bacterium]|nr:recombination protein NinB [Steroidobacteraceae bacterium]